MLRQCAWHSPAPSVGACIWPRGRARLSLKQELLGGTQALGLGSQRCTKLCSPWGLAGTPSLGRPSVLPWALEPAKLLSMSLCPPLNVCLPSPASWSTVEQSLIKLGENLNSLSNSPLRSQADDCVSLIKR